ncbi:hypothetical protein, partial [Treponema sp. R6D11]
MIKQVMIDIPALHGVEYVYACIINHIVHNFKRVAIIIKPQKQMLVFCIIPNVIINNIDYSIPDSCFGNAMLKGRRVEFNSNVHTFNITQKEQGINKQLTPAQTTAVGGLPLLVEGEV